MVDGDGNVLQEFAPVIKRKIKFNRDHLTIVLNGGLTTLEDGVAQLTHVDGIMLGRAAIQDSWLLARIDEHLFGAPPPEEPQVLRAYERYVAAELERGTPLKVMTRPLLGMRSARPGGRRWRRGLTELGDGSIGLDELRALVRTFAPTATASPA